MTATTLPAAPGRAVTRLTALTTRRGALVIACAATGLSALVAVQFQATFADQLGAESIRALAENPAVRVLFGPARALDDPGGFTVWRTGTPVLVLCGIWALLAATRLTRGEEETGRTELLLAGRLRPIDLLTRTMAVLAVLGVLIAASVGAGLLAAGTGAAGAVLHAGCVLGAIATFAAVGLLAAQLAPTRAGASGLAAGVLAVSLLLRMVADGVPALASAAWLTPFGLAGRVAPFAENNPAPLLVLAALALAPAAAAVAVAARRDLGAAPIARTRSRAPRTRLLGSPGGFALRRALAPTFGWALGIGAYFLLVGAITTSILEFFDTNTRFADLAATAGFGGLSTATGFAAALLAILAVPAGLYAAGRIAAMAEHERARRFTSLHAGPSTRTRLACAEIAATVAGLITLLGVAAVGMWVGARLTGAPLTPTDTLAGAANIAPVALLALGGAVLALGWYPRAVTAIGAVPVAGGFLLDITARSVGAPAWVAQLSPFAHLAPVPDAPPNWTATLVCTGIAAALTVLGLRGYRHRDLLG
ncbi:polyketide antibiotic transporter [Nocardia harenae]|uniref:polyketide antibiotic transporter n=1 Tax=Nocardia harenae TaxID=358707 RepID=UPI00082F5A06|nr:polyketide antibiotic transporter [Nocardia harenae]